MSVSVGKARANNVKARNKHILLLLNRPARMPGELVLVEIQRQTLITDEFDCATS